MNTIERCTWVKYTLALAAAIAIAGVIGRVVVHLLFWYRG